MVEAADPDHYLNQVYFGSLAYGAEAAAQTYFSRPARALTLSPGRAARGADQGALGIRPVHRADRGACPAHSGARRHAADGRHHPGRSTTGRRVAPLGLDPGRLYTRIREPYFFGYVRDR